MITFELVIVLDIVARNTRSLFIMSSFVAYWYSFISVYEWRCYQNQQIIVKARNTSKRKTQMSVNNLFFLSLSSFYYILYDLISRSLEAYFENLSWQTMAIKWILMHNNIFYFVTRKNKTFLFILHYFNKGVSFYLILKWLYQWGE